MPDGVTRYYRVIEETGGVYFMDLEARPGGFWVHRAGFAGEEHLTPPEGSPFFWQIEQCRRGQGRVVVAVAVGPRLPDQYEPDWSRCVLGAVLNPLPPHAYGALSSAVHHIPGATWAKGFPPAKASAPSAGEPAAERRGRGRDGLSADEVAKREKACEASRKSRERRQLRAQGLSEEEIRARVP